MGLQQADAIATAAEAGGDGAGAAGAVPVEIGLVAAGEFGCGRFHQDAISCILKLQFHRFGGGAPVEGLHPKAQLARCPSDTGTAANCGGDTIIVDPASGEGKAQFAGVDVRHTQAGEFGFASGAGIAALYQRPAGGLGFARSGEVADRFCIVACEYRKLLISADAHKLGLS